MDTLSIPLEVVELKADGDARTFTAYASTFGNTDHGGDVIVKGAFKDSLRARSFRPLLWQHDQRQPIGVEKSLREDSKGLVGTWELLKSGPGEYAYEALKLGAVRAMSIGYIPQIVEFREEGDGERFLKQVDLLENSVVSLPMNEQALVQRVKYHYCPECGSGLDHHTDDKSSRSGDPSAVPTTTTETTSLTDLLDKLSFNELAAFMAQLHDQFGEGARKLLVSLTDGNSLTDTKRQELERVLGTFPGLDAVRSDVQRLLATASEPPPAAPTAPVTDGDGMAESALGLRLEMRRRRLRAAGIEV